ncbi:MAG: hypothetical protein HZB25_09705 [Candidatus Eisenbacteria bacterium]|nr:hypothetical protein [Candidatus Eisenbacteria bacterium]
MSPDAGMRVAFERIVRRTGARGRLCAVLDFDGTLVAFAPDPGGARLDGLARLTLETLLDTRGVHVGILSSRGAADLARAVNLDGVELVASNGLERVHLGAALPLPGFVPPEPVLVEAVRDLVLRHPPARMEVKPAGLCVHVSRLTIAQRDDLARDLVRMSASLGSGRVESGRWVRCRRCFEWMPAAAGKGRALRQLLRQWRHAPADIALYAGDDTNDIDAFEQVRAAGGLAISVGRRALPGTEFRVPSPGDLAEFLWRVARQLRSAAFTGRRGLAHAREGD